MGYKMKKNIKLDFVDTSLEEVIIGPKEQNTIIFRFNEFVENDKGEIISKITDLILENVKKSDIQNVITLKNRTVVDFSLTRKNNLFYCSLILADGRDDEFLTKINLVFTNYNLIHKNN